VIIEVEGLVRRYGQVTALDGVSFSVEEGETFGLLGPNGAGKTTLMEILCGLRKLDEGRVMVSGFDLVRDSRRVRGLIGFCPQETLLYDLLSVKENLSIAARNSNKEGAWTLERVYSLFPILKDRAKLHANLLSGGEQQMMTIGRALMTNPDLLLMVEPSEGLAPLIVKVISRVIGQLKGGHSVLLAEQNLSMALNLADYVYIISKGTVVYQSTPQELRNNEEVKSKHLGV
jgi:branched-chain amino acid transport system ATP-binding protein